MSFPPRLQASQVPVFLISLPDQIARRDFLVEQGVPKEWVNNYLSAIDGRTNRASHLAGKSDVKTLKKLYGRHLLSTEVACALSHRQVFHWLVSSDCPLALVLEDDINPAVDNWLQAIDDLARVLTVLAQKKKALVCHLGARHDQADQALSRSVVLSGRNLPTHLPNLLLHIDPTCSLWRAHAYLISRAAALNLLGYEKVASLADDWGEHRRRGSLSLLFYTRPILIGQNEVVASTIGLATVRRSTTEAVVVRDMAIRDCFRFSYVSAILKKFFSSLWYRLNYARRLIMSFIPCRFAILP